MEAITKDEFLQGAIFTHKYYTEKYKCIDGSEKLPPYLANTDMNHIRTYTIHTITETSFTVSELLFGTFIDVVVLFSECLAVEKN